MIITGNKTKSDLEKEYSVFGWFYDIKNKGRYRSVLEIHRNSQSKKIEPYLINAYPIDLVVIMMNPGGSKPVNKNDVVKIDRIKELNKLYQIKKLVPTDPDLTQYQLMRVMDSVTSINSMRVLNLSDIREANSIDLPKQLIDSDNHSLFLGTRKDELETLFTKKVPILLAYGSISKLKPCAKKAHEFIGNRTIIGVTEPGREFYYWHPLRRFKKNTEWVEKIINEIKQKSIFN